MRALPIPARGRSRIARWACTLLLVVLAARGVAAQDPPEVAEDRPPGPVVVMEIDTIIHPVAADFLREAIEEAERLDAEALVVQLSTPGGLLTSTREMSTAMLGARVPIVAWVAPSGAQAASAGFFLLMSADVAAMAPGTNTGAAHPVGAEGQDIEGHLGEKAEQDAAANIRSLAARYGRNVELAEAAVVESRSFTAEEALAAGLIDLVAPSLPRLMIELDGRTVVEQEGETTVLRTADADVVRLEMSPVQRFLATIAHPNVAYILFTLGFLGLYFEFANPGAVLPGVVGAICLILGFYALSVLPLNFAGVALILLAMILFIAEVKVTSYGLLTVGGVVALVLGSLMLFKSPDPALRVSLSLIGAVTASILVTALFLMTLVIRTHRSRITTGSEGLVGEVGIVRVPISPRGKVFVHGEIWQATAEVPLQVGERVRVAAKDGMWLRVAPELVAPSEERPPAPPDPGEETAWNP